MTHRTATRPSTATRSTGRGSRRVGAAVGALALAATLTAVAPGAARASSPAAASASAPVLQSGALLSIEQIRGAGLAVDSATLDTTGSALIGDAGRFDEGCLGEKSIRNITGAKDYPARGTAKAYVDGTWTSTLDKEVWVREGLTEAYGASLADRYVATLREAVAHVRSCEQDPTQGHHYGPATTVTAGAATAEIYLDYTADGRATGGGTAILRDGTRVGYLDLMSGSTGTLRRLAVAAASRLR